ncbi:MAG: LysM peptidoglycan-binding domain-containing protein [Syntrophomonadaceae bacterium]|nr:LysM peptidoglycan-binding domain-containing protein [Syntrophomonadaceae bacterium]
MAKYNLIFIRRPTSPWRCDGFLYTIQPGDTLYEISRREQIPLDKLIAVNPQIKNPDRIKPGDRICIPRGEHDANPCSPPAPWKSIWAE